MTTATLPNEVPAGSFLMERAPHPTEWDEVGGGDGRAADGREGVRRRCGAAHGQALEMLGHAVEYLVDSSLFLADAQSWKDQHAAVQVLMRLSRAVFAECPEAEPLQRRVGRWMRAQIDRNGRS